MTYSEHRKRADREYLRQLLDAHACTTDAARAAGVNRVTLYRIAGRCGFEMPARPPGNRGNQVWQRLTAESRPQC